MPTKTKSKFKSVEYMRQVRNELSALVQTDTKRFHEELKVAMDDFVAKRKQASSKHIIAEVVAE